MGLGLGSCSQGLNPSSATDLAQTAAAEPVTQPFLALPNPSADLQQAARLTQAKARRLVVPADAVSVDIYSLDNRCEAFQTESVLMSRPNSVTETVGLILAEVPIAKLDLSGYRVEVQPDTRSATVDLRVSRGSRRILQSLSSCEQKALLGSLKETLVNHPDWGIDQVEFTNRGNRLVF